MAVAVCTYNRNEPLQNLLNALLANAGCAAHRARVGVVVVDDSADGNAQDIVAGFDGRFELGIYYRRSGRQNISIARNLAVETAAELAEWVAMTDDDCEPVPGWVEALLDMQERTQTDAICGCYRRRAPEDAPGWLKEEPFLEVAVHAFEDGAEIDVAGTNNSMISSSWWKAHPEVRFRPDLGVTGGEDMVFYRTAHAAGLRIAFAERAVVFENEPRSRTTLTYQLRHFLWLGNSSYVTRLEAGLGTPFRMFLQGGNQVRRALLRPVIRIFKRKNPQLRYCLAGILFGVGLLLGPFGFRAAHP